MEMLLNNGMFWGLLMGIFAAAAVLTARYFENRKKYTAPSL